MTKKYKLTDITMEFEGRTLYRIRALKDFSNVEKGDLGGWIQSEDNLSQKGYCWIYDNAKCMDDARMYDNSRMYDDSVMYDYSAILDDSRMYDNSEMHDYSVMYDYSAIFDNSRMYGHSVMYNDSEMHDCSKMHDYSRMYGSSEMCGKSEMFDNSEMHDCSEMCGDSKLKGREKLYGKLVSEVDNFIEINNKEGDMVTGVLKKGKMLFNIDYFEEITKEELLDIIYNEDGGIEENPHRKEYLKIIDMIELYFSK